MCSTKDRGEIPGLPLWSYVIMSSNTTDIVAKTSGPPYYFSLLAQNEQKYRPQNEDRIRGIA